MYLCYFFFGLQVLFQVWRKGNEGIIANMKGGFAMVGLKKRLQPDFRVRLVRWHEPVSYTHLDVYKRQSLTYRWNI